MATGSIFHFTGGFKIFEGYGNIIVANLALPSFNISRVILGVRLVCDSIVYALIFCVLTIFLINDPMKHFDCCPFCIFL
jgi:hypothetical protein